MQNTNMFLHHRYCMHLPFYIIFIQLLSKFAAQSFGVAAGGTPDAPYQTLQFTPNVTHRTDLCDRQLSMRLGELEFPDILRGANISVALGYFPDTGSVIYDEVGQGFFKSLSSTF